MPGWRWMGWRATPPLRPIPPPPAGFDAVISVGPYNLPPGVSPAQAVVAIRQAVNALPGAGWVSVEHHPGGTGADAVAVTPAPEADGAETGERVQAAVARVLAGLIAAAPRAIPAVAAPIVAPVPPLPSAAVRVPGLPGEAVNEVFPLPTAAMGPAAGMAEPPVRVLDALAALDELASLASLPPPAPAPPPGNVARMPGDVELLASLLNRVLPGPEVAAATARAAVAAHGSYAAVLAQPASTLLKMPGLGPHSVAAIKVVHEAALRLARAAVMDGPALLSSDALIPYLTAVLAREPLEHFRVLFLDRAGRVRADEAQARGTVNHTPVYPREVARRALELEAASVVLVHNHPSGDPSPSTDDLHMTQAVQDACGTVGIAVWDHVIVGNGRWFSFRAEGHIAPDP